MSVKKSVTVVIATLGGESLALTIERLNSGSVPPDEILICIPAENRDKVKHLHQGNVVILACNVRGQVAQRLFGFQNASHEAVMQLDDDMLLDKFCLERLLATLNAEGFRVAVAPAFINGKTGKSAYAKPDAGRVVSSIYYWLMNGSAGYAPGCIDKSGSAVGIDPATSEKILHDVEWLAGGCVLHLRENLVLENFWPLPGKAYYEDVVHSSILVANGIRLVIDPSARCSLELAYQASLRPGDFYRNLKGDYLGRAYFMRRFSRRSFRTHIYYFGRILSYLFSRWK